MKNIVKVGINRYIVIGVILANGHDFTFKHNKNLCKDRNNNEDWGNGLYFISPSTFSLSRLLID